MSKVKSLSSMLIVCVAAAGAAFAADVLSQLNVQPEQARRLVLQGVVQGSLYSNAGGAALKAAPPAARAALADGAVAWVKAYTQSAEFKQAYAKAREDAKPVAPSFTGTPEEEFAKKQAADKAEQEKNAAEMKKMLPTLPQDQRQAIEEGLKVAAAAAAQMDTPEMRQMMIQGIAMERQRKQQEFDEQTTHWQESYPEDVNALLAARLQHFLDVSGTVDFAAELKPRGDGKMVFVNPAYEGKSDEWKRCFRAGKEATTAARAAVQAWLAEVSKR
jgi:hypothetical protein